MGILNLLGLEKKSSDYDLNGNRFYSQYIVNNNFDTLDVRPLKVAAALRAGLTIASDIARMPLEVYSTDRKGAKTQVYDGVALLLGSKPNSYMTCMEFVEFVTLQAVYSGNGFAWIERKKGTPVALHPVEQGKITVSYDKISGKVTYEGDPTGHGQPKHYQRSDFIHISQPRLAQYSGVNVSKELEEVLKLALRLQVRQSQDAESSAMRGIISFKTQISPDTAEKVSKALSQLGAKIPILDSDAQYKPTQQTAHDMQLLQTKRSVIEDIARMFGIHPLMLGHDGAGQSLTRVADVQDYHKAFTLSPWMERWQQAVEFSLLGRREKVCFDERKLFTLNPTEKSEYSAKALGSGGGKPWMTVNEVRELHGLPPIAGGDKLANTAPTSESDDEQNLDEALKELNGK